MKDSKKGSGLDVDDREIVLSQSIKAGKHIYYLDVKENRRSEVFPAITESRRVVMGEGNDSQVGFKKHKIFLYKEDFERFMNGLQQTIGFVREQQGSYARYNDNEDLPDSRRPTIGQEEEGPSLDGEIKIDIDF